MKVGDLVRTANSEAIGLVVDFTDKKVWRVHDKGQKVNWDKVLPESHAVVLYSHNDGALDIPTAELEVVK